jgi:hypothetical protein
LSFTQRIFSDCFDKKSLNVKQFIKSENIINKRISVEYVIKKFHEIDKTIDLVIDDNLKKHFPIEQKILFWHDVDNRDNIFKNSLKCFKLFS